MTNKQRTAMHEAKDFINVKIREAYNSNWDYETITEMIFKQLFHDFTLGTKAHREVMGYYDGIVEGLQMAQTNFGQYSANFARITLKEAI
jgi:hypothetical protein